MNLPKVYEPKEYESDIYALWEKAGAFEPKNRGGKGRFSLVMPPPNANGDLHLGHALTNAVEDILIRYHRMKGEEALYVPGADHAGFETWVVYEKKLNSEGKTRFDFSREELYQQVWDFVQMHKSSYESQLRALGASCDWTRFTFTLDDKVVRTAYNTFKKMWDDKLIYRGKRLVNFCTFHGTSFSDIEVLFRDEKSKLWHINYPLTDGSGHITVATTRPETMLGDTAVAVNPTDDRYKEFIGKTVKVPLTNREVPVIADDYVDKKFGTGAVKVTPAHDQNDFDIAQRHDLPLITVINFQGEMTHEVPQAYRGLYVNDAREKVVSDLKAGKHLAKEEDYNHSVGHCYKCNLVIQPLLKEQWFIAMAPLVEPALKAIDDKKVEFHPASKGKQLAEYFKNIRDWNISRQIAWGIPIPAFQNIDDPDDWIYDERVAEETIDVEGKTYRRDPDVFDTWFSSSQWPYITLNYPDGEEYKHYYPLDVMETGVDILMPWVSRMLVMGLYITGEVPFKNTYLHGLILDEHGAKMSKSKGNVTSPIDVINQYGSDALRMGLVAGQTPGNNQPFTMARAVGGRNFCNKLWNVARFTEGIIGSGDPGTPEPRTPADHWILLKLQQAVKNTGQAIEKYRFSEAQDIVYHTLWDDLADWYIEASKSSPNKGVLAYAINTVLAIAHPFAPFVTETIWQTLPWVKDQLITSPWPEELKADKDLAKEFDELKDIVGEVRQIRSNLQLAQPSLYYTSAPFIAQNSALIAKMANLSNVAEVTAGKGLHLTHTPYNCWLDVDVETARHYRSKLEATRQSYELTIKQLETRLAAPGYMKKAPKAIVAETKHALEAAKQQLEQVSKELSAFEAASKEL